MVMGSHRSAAAEAGTERSCTGEIPLLGSLWQEHRSPLRGCVLPNASQEKRCSRDRLMGGVVTCHPSELGSSWDANGPFQHPLEC